MLLLQADLQRDVISVVRLHLVQPVCVQIGIREDHRNDIQQLFIAALEFAYHGVLCRVSIMVAKAWLH